MRQRKTPAKAPESAPPDYHRLAETIPQIVWTARPDGWLDYYNQRWTEYTGLSIEESQGSGWAPVIHPDDLDNCVQKWDRAVATGEVYEVEYRFRRASDGVYRWYLGRAIPVRDGEGQIVKWVGTCTDIHDQKQAQDELRRVRAELTAELQHSENRYRLIVETANEGIWALDADLLTCYINRKMQEILGYSPSEMYGRPVTDFVFEEDIPRVEGMLRDRKAGLRGNFERRYRHRNGSERWLAVSVSPVTDDGTWRGATALVTDVTETRRTTALMGALNEMYKDMVDNATDLIYTTDSAGTFTYFNPTAVRTMKYTEEQLYRMSYLDLIHPDCRQAARRFYGRQFVRRLADSHYEYPATTAHGDIIWLDQHVHLLVEDGVVIGFQAVARDITARKNAETQLKESEERLSRLADASFEAIFLSDNGIVIDVGAQACVLFGYSREELIGKNGVELVAPSHRALAVEIAAAGSEEMYLSRCVRKDGTEFSVEVRGRNVPLRGHQARLAAIRDITQRQRYEEEIEHQRWQLQQANEDLRSNNERLTELATTDGLTGLKNHRSFQETLAAEWMRSIRYSMPLCLLMLDVDHFKGFNDKFGHPAGDEVLRNVARILQENVRNVDIAARYGGEEFAIIQPNTDGPSGLILAERIRAAIEAEPWEHRSITVSIGAAWGLDYPYDMRDLVALADRALYQSKGGGRNRITLLSAADAPAPAQAPPRKPE